MAFGAFRKMLNQLTACSDSRGIGIDHSVIRHSVRYGCFDFTTICFQRVHIDVDVKPLIRLFEQDVRIEAV